MRLARAQVAQGEQRMRNNYGRGGLEPQWAQPFQSAPKRLPFRLPFLPHRQELLWTLFCSELYPSTERPLARPPTHLAEQVVVGVGVQGGHGPRRPKPGVHALGRQQSKAWTVAAVRPRQDWLGGTSAGRQIRCSLARGGRLARCSDESSQTKLAFRQRKRLHPRTATGATSSAAQRTPPLPLPLLRQPSHLELPLAQAAVVWLPDVTGQLWDLAGRGRQRGGEITRWTINLEGRAQPGWCASLALPGDSDRELQTTEAPRCRARKNGAPAQRGGAARGSRAALALAPAPAPRSRAPPRPRRRRPVQLQGRRLLPSLAPGCVGQ